MGSPRSEKPLAYADSLLWRVAIGYTVPTSRSLRDVAGAKPAISKWQLAISQTAERFGREFQDGSRRREGTAGETRQGLIYVPAVQGGNLNKCSPEARAGLTARTETTSNDKQRGHPGGRPLLFG
jgi:hypothetical protein